MDFLVRARFLVSQATLSRKKWTVWQWSVGTRCTIRVAIEGEFRLLYRTLVGFVSAVHDETHQSGGVRSIPFGPKLFVGVVVGDSFKFLVALGQFDWIN